MLLRDDKQAPCFEGDSAKETLERFVRVSVSVSRFKVDSLARHANERDKN